MEIPEPEQKTLSLVKKGLPQSKEEVSAMAVRSKADNDKAVEFLKGLRDLWKKVEAERKKVSKPLDEAKKALQSQYKPILDEIEGLASEVKGKVNKWVKSEEKRIATLNEKLEQKNREVIEQAAETGEIPANVIAPPRTLTTASGQSVRKVRKFRIIDKSKIPAEFMVVDIIAIRRAMFDGISVPGVEYYEESRVAIRG